jgi:hypothetical protein
VSPEHDVHYRISLHEVRADGTTKERLAGDCSAYVIAISEERDGELRVLTDHDGPVRQRHKAIRSLTEHIRATIGLGR